MVINSPQRSKTVSTLDDLSLTNKVVESPQDRQIYFMDRVGRMVKFLFTILNWLIVVRVILLAIAAEPTQPLVAGLYEFTQPFVTPFFGIVENPAFEITDDGFETIRITSRNADDLHQVAEFTSVIAIIVYAIAGGLASQFIKLLFGRPRSNAAIRSI